MPATPVGMQMIVLRGFVTYSSFPKWQFLTAMTATMMKKKRVKSHKGHSVNYTPSTPASTNRKADNGAKREWNIPISSR